MSNQIRNIRLIPANSSVQVAFEFRAKIDVDLIEQALKAAEKHSPAPKLKITWPSDEENGATDRKLILFGTDHDVSQLNQSSDTEIQFNVTVKHAFGGTEENDPLVLEITSGSVQILLVEEAPGRDTLLKLIWPNEDRGQLVRLDLLPSGLGIHVKVPRETSLAYHLEEVRLNSERKPERLRWRHISWSNPVDKKYQQPAERLSSLESHIKALNQATGFEVIERLSDAHSGSVCVEVDATGDDPQAVEVFQPGWSLRIHGTTWKPRGLCLVNDNELRFTDGEYALFDKLPSASSDDANSDTQVIWNDENISAEMLPKLTTTGQTFGGAANLPYLWQYGPVQEEAGEDGHARIEPAAWIRYRLDPKSRTTTPAATRQALEQSGLSSSLSIPLSNQWRLELSPAPLADKVASGNDTHLTARLNLVVNLEENDDTKSFSEAKLTVHRSLVRALSPGLRVYRPRLADPSAIPNSASLVDVLSTARLEFASDIDDLSSESTRGNSYLTLDINSKELRLIAGDESVIAFVPGPEAGIQLISWSGANLQRAAVKPSERGRSVGSTSRDYNQGLVPIRIAEFAFSENNESPSYLNISLAITRSESSLVPTEATAALLPWTTWKQGAEDAGTITRKAFHRNLAQEHPEWETASVDQARNLVEPLTSTNGAGNSSENQWSGLQRRDEDLRDVRDAIRDQFSEAASDLLDSDSRVENWLEQVTFDDESKVPRIKLGYDSESKLIKLEGLAEQTLQLSANSSAAPQGWLRTHLKWPIKGEKDQGENDSSPQNPRLTVAEDASQGAFLADGSSVSILHRYADIVAMDAAVVAGRLFVIFADARGKIYQWEPLNQSSDTKRGEPEVLDIHPAFNRIREIRAASYKSTLCLIISSDQLVRAFHFDLSGSQLRHVPTDQDLTVPIDFDGSEVMATVLTAVSATSFVASVSLNNGEVWGSEIKSRSIEPLFRELFGGAVTAISSRYSETDETTHSFTVCIASKDNDLKLNILEWDGRLSRSRGRQTVTVDVANNGSINDLIIPHVRSGDNSSLHILASIVSEGSFPPKRQTLFWRLARNEEGEIGLAKSSSVLDPSSASDRDWVAMAMDKPSSGESKYLVSGSVGNERDGKAVVGRWELDWGHEQDAGASEPRISSVAFGAGHLGSIKNVSVVREPGAEYLVTAGSDGTVRLWDTASCQEIRRCTAPDDSRWLDNLGVQRSGALLANANNWRVEQLSVPKENGRVEVRSLSTEKPISLEVRDSDGESNATDIQFSCLDLKLERIEGDNDTWKPTELQQIEQGRYGVYSASNDVPSNDIVSNDTPSDDTPSRWPRLWGFPVYVVGLESVTFSGQEENKTLTVACLTLKAVLANPTKWNQKPDEASIPAMVAEAVAAKKLLRLKFHRQDEGDVLLLKSSDEDSLGEFYWRFDMADQLPIATSPSAFPGRLARLSGTVKLHEGTLELTPNAKDCLASAFGKLWRLEECPNIRWNSMTREFREVVPEQEKNKLNHRRSFDQCTEDTPAIALNHSGDRTEALTACSGGQPDVLIRWDTETALPQTRYSQAVRSGALSVFRSRPANGSDTITERLDALLVYADGSAGLWHLRESSKNGEDWETNGSFNAQEWNRYRLDSAIEGVDVFEVCEDGSGPTTARYFLFRCANGTAELWEETRGKIHAFSFPEAAITTAVFGPNLKPIFGNDLPTLWKRKGVVDHTSEIVFALGGSDGSVRVYAHSRIADEDGNTDADTPGSTRSVREFFDHRDPITSLSMAVDHSVPEAKGPGLYLLVTTEKAGPPQLIELVTRSNSYRSKAAADKINSCHQFADQFSSKFGIDADAQCAVVSNSTTVPSSRAIFLFLVDGEQQPKLHFVFRKNATANDITVFYDFQELGVSDPGKVVVGMQQDGFSFVIAEGAASLEAIRFQSTSPDSESNKLSDTKHQPSSICLCGGRQHVLGIDEVGGISLWIQVSPPDNNWKREEQTIGEHAEPKSVGFVDIPVPFLIHASDAEAGDVWDAELNCSRYRIPRGICGHPEWPRAFTLLDGVPHLAVAEKSIVRLWNLDTHEQVHLFLHEQDVVEVDLACESGTAWLLTRQGSGKVTLWNVANLQGKVLVEKSKAAKVRFEAALDGLMVLAASESDGNNSLRIIRANVATLMSSEDALKLIQDTEIEVTSIKSIETLVHSHDDSLVTWTAVLAEVSETDAGDPAPRVLMVYGVPNTPKSKLIDPTIEAVTFGQEQQGPFLLVIDREWNLRRFILPFSDEEINSNDAQLVKLSALPRPEGAKPLSIHERSIGSQRCLIILGKGGSGSTFYEVWQIDEEAPILVRQQMLGSGSVTLADAVIPGVFALDGSAKLFAWDRDSGQRRISLAGPLDGSGELVWVQAFPNLARPLLVCGRAQGAFLFDLLNRSWHPLTARDEEPEFKVQAGASLIHTTDKGHGLRLVQVVDSTGNGDRVELRAREFDLTTVPASRNDIELPEPYGDLLNNLDKNAKVVLVESPSKETRVIVSTGRGENGVYVLDLGDWEDEESSKTLIQLPISLVPELLSATISQAGDSMYVVAGGNTEDSLTLWELSSEGLTESSHWTISGKHQAVAIVATASGPQILAAGADHAGIYAPRQLLRVRPEALPVFDLPITLFNEDKGNEVEGNNKALNLRGYINPARRLEVELEHAGRGLPKTIPLQSAIVQGGYYGYLIETPDLDGYLVCWDSESDSGISGLVCVEEKPDAGIITTAHVRIDSLKISCGGPRRRMHVFGFGDEQALNRSVEMISWELSGELQFELRNTHYQQIIRLQIHDQPLPLSTDKDGNGISVILAHLQVTVKNQVTAQNGIEFQGFVPVEVEKKGEDYTFTLSNSIHAVQGFDRTLDSDIIRDDVVFPMLRSSANPLRGRAFNLSEAVPEDLAAESSVSFRFVSFRIHNGRIVLRTIDPLNMPIDLSLPPETFRLADRLPPSVPSLVHRHGQGSQLRVWLPNSIKPHAPEDAGRILQHARRLLLRPVVETPDGLKILADSLVFHSEVRQRRWERSRSESLLFVHRSGDCVFDVPGLSLGNGAAVGTLLSRCLELGATSESTPLLDDQAIREHLLETGNDGIIVARVLDGDGKLSYRFVSSPFHSLETMAPMVEVEQDSSPGGADSEETTEGHNEIDPYLLPPEQAAALTFNPDSRYRPTRPTPFPILSGHETAQDPVALMRHLRYQYDSAKLPSDTACLRLDEVTAFASRPVRSIAPQQGAVEENDSPTPNKPHRFIPTEIELRHGIDKPGAMFHHTARVVIDKQIGGLSELAIREPQRFIPPSGAKVELESITETPNSDRSLPSGLKRIRIAWKETLGEVPLSDLELADEITIESHEDPDKPSTRKDNRLFAFVVRIGEQVFRTTVDDRLLFVPRINQPNSNAYQAYELRLVTKIANLDQAINLDGNEGDDEEEIELENENTPGTAPVDDEDFERENNATADAEVEDTEAEGGADPTDDDDPANETTTNENTSRKLFVVVTKRTGPDREPEGDAMMFSQAFSLEPSVQKEGDNDVWVWGATRELLRMITRHSSKDAVDLGLDFVWLPVAQSSELGERYSDAAKVFPGDCPSLRFVDIRQTAPRIAAVLRQADGDNGNGHWLGKERTLFYGESASVRGAKAQIVGPHDFRSLRLTASDAESLVVPASLVGDQTNIEQILVKYFDNGETILATKREIE